MATAEGPRYLALLPPSTLFLHRTQREAAVGAAEGELKARGRVKRVGTRAAHASRSN
jgi:hypothetical protein